MKSVETAVWNVSIFCDCPYCGELQDLLDDNGEPRLPENLMLGEHKTDKTTNIKIWCIDCGKDFIIKRLVW